MARGAVVRIAVCVVLAAATFIVYAGVLGHEFTVYDDQMYVTENASVKAGLTADGVRWAFTTARAANWHPLTWLSHMLDVTLFGLDPGMHHLSSLLLHVANAVLLLLVLDRITGCFGRSAFVAALFAIHPLHVESVAWAAERKDVLSSLFWILTIGAYALWVERPTRGRYAIAVLLFALGLMAKPMLVTLPFVLLLLDWWPLGRMKIAGVQGGNGGEPKGLGALVVEKAPFFALAALSSVVTFAVQRGGGAVGTTVKFPVDRRLGNAVVAFVRYLAKTLWPADLAAFYPYPASLAVWMVAGSALVVAGITVAVVLLARRHPYLPTGWFWYLGTLVPVIGLVQVGMQSMADRYSYIPLIGIFLAFVWGAGEIRKRLGIPAAVPAAIGVLALAALSVAAYRQVGVWKSTITLFDHALEVTTDNPVAHNVLANVLAKQGRIDDAIPHFEKASRILPDYETSAHLGLALAMKGRFDDAIVRFRESLRLKADEVETRMHLAEVLHRKGRTAEAIGEYAAVVDGRPDDVRVRTNYAAALADAGRTDDAIAQYEEAIRLAPGYAEAHNNLGVALAARGRAGEALGHYEQAVRLKPGFGDARFNLASALVAAGRAGEGIQALGELAKIAPDYPGARALLERAIALQGAPSPRPSARSLPRTRG